MASSFTLIFFFLLSVYKSHCYRGLQLNNHFEIFPVKILGLNLISCPCDSGGGAWKSHLSKHINNRAGSYWPSLPHAWEKDVGAQLFVAFHF